MSRKCQTKYSIWRKLKKREDTMKNFKRQLIMAFALFAGMLDPECKIQQ